MRVREWTLLDYDVIYRIWQHAAPGVHVGASDTRAEIAKKLAHDPDLALAAEVDGCIHGAVLGGFDGRRGWVYHLAVEPDWRGQGIGHALMTELERRFAAKGCLKLYLFVTPDNQDVVRYYESLGWAVSPLIAMSKQIC
jgi:ribosomal protein S18 acetylase RimI-like enzyme